MIIENLDDSILQKVTIDGVENCFILQNVFVEKILFNRGLIGGDFSSACYQASLSFMKHFAQFLDTTSISELMILSKGFYYKFHDAYYHAIGKNLEINFIATKREAVESHRVKIAIPYSDICAKSDTLLIGDTVASGETICAAVEHYCSFYPLKRLVVFTIAGSKVGGQRISNYCRENGIEFIIVYSLALFGLASNGFDLSFLHPDTISDTKYIERAQEVFEGKPISSAGLDFGSQAQCIRKYKNLCYLEMKYWDVSESVFPCIDSSIDEYLVRKEISAFGR